jgi:nucleoside-diphosphate-sugar epimerase
MDELIRTEEELDERLSRPAPELVQSLGALDGDLLVLGAGGKMGPHLSRMAVRAAREAGRKLRVVAVSRFTDQVVRRRMEEWGIETVACDLLEPGALDRLPRLPNVVYMAARGFGKVGKFGKFGNFGSTGGEWETWATNTFLAGQAARAFAGARIVAFSTGNVYPLWPADSEGPDESSPTGPLGEYAQSCLGRERMFEYGSSRDGTPVTLIRLNYAIELRSGVLCDLARMVAAEEPIDLSMGFVNVIWQADANARVLMALPHCAVPPLVLNVTGDKFRVRDAALRLGQLMGRTPRFATEEPPTALLSNAARCRARFGPPPVSLDQLLVWTAHWVSSGGRTLGKPTRFQVRDGRA